MAGDPLQSKRQEWDAIFADPELSTHSLRQQAITAKVCQSGLRSVCWKVFMEYFTSVDFSSWPAVQIEQRQRYSNLKNRYIDEPARRMTEKADDVTDNNPLALSENNPWQQYFADLEIRKVIRQDVDRTFPDIEFFRSGDVQEQMTDILFVYCKLNHDVSYRQGMHELLAPLYWTLATESINAAGEIGPADSTNKLLLQVLDANYVEHDAYLLFEKLMHFAKPWYEFNENTSSRATLARNSTSGQLTRDARLQLSKSNSHRNPVLSACQRIQNEYLRTVDPVLYQHLESFGIEPQLYGMRWLRLLFGREFEFHDLLKLWDAIFAQDQTLKIVEFVCVTLLLRMRDKLLGGDYAECLTLLMRGAQIRNPATLVQQAHYLQNNISEQGGLHILQQNDLQSGKPPRASLWDGIQRPDQATEPTSPSKNRIKHRKSHGANLDGFASITRGVMKSPQVRDLNKAIAGVMGTVQKNVNIIGDNLRNSNLDSPTFRRRLTVSSEFPAGVERQTQYTTANRFTSSPQQQQQQPIRQPMISSPIERPPREDSLISSFKATNRQMGEVLAKCIDILETEMFSHKKQKSSSSPEKQEEEEAQNEQTETEDKGVTSEQQKEKALPENKVDQAKVIGALAGLKHVRDVLCGKQTLFDAAAIQSFFESDNKKYEARSSLSEWDVISYDGQQETERERTQQQRASSLDTAAAQDTKAHSPPKKTDEKMNQQTMTTASAPASSRTHPAKQHVVYSIEDLLADPSLQTGGVEKSEKFQWMSAAAAAGAPKNDQAASEPRRPVSLRKYSSNQSMSQSRPVAASAVDPLDAKNVDKKKAYEYDIL